MAMSAGTTAFRSILDKPLNQLTEDDISQLTREDCRKYLKDKGMRRPSWNKSQAIQQVISLKALLEPCDDSSTASLRKVVIPPRVTSYPSDSAREPSDNVEIQVSVDEPVPDSRSEPLKSASEDPIADPDSKATSPRSQCMTTASLGQLTIFYGGKVNVYDGVPPDKARAIMHLAASPIHFPQDDPFGGSAAALRPFPFQLQSANDSEGPFPPTAAINDHMQTEKVIEPSQLHCEKECRDTYVEGQANRKVSLQRYLEKRKDRGRVKNKKNVGLSSSLEAYVNHHVKIHVSNENSSWNTMSPPSQPGLPQQAYGRTADNRPKIACLPVDLNVKDVHEF